MKANVYLKGLKSLPKSTLLRMVEDLADNQIRSKMKTGAANLRRQKEKPQVLIRSPPGSPTRALPPDLAVSTIQDGHHDSINAESQTNPFEELFNLDNPLFLKKLKEYVPEVEKEELSRKRMKKKKKRKPSSKLKLPKTKHGGRILKKRKINTMTNLKHGED